MSEPSQTAQTSWALHSTCTRAAGQPEEEGPATLLGRDRVVNMLRTLMNKARIGALPQA